LANQLFIALGREPRGKKAPKPKPSPSHLRAREQEREAAKRVRGSLTPASGAKDIKGDVRKTGVCRIECKTTKHSSFSVTLDMVRRIEEAALPYGEMPIILVEFNDGAGKKVAELAIVPSYILDQLCHR